MAFVDRVQAVLLKPQLAWPAIAAEPDTVANIFQRYAIPLAAIPAICQAVGLLAFGVTLPYVGHLSYSVVYVVASSIVRFVTSLISIFVLAQVLDALAPSFGTLKNPLQAMKVAAYSFTPTAVLSVFSLFPLASVIGVLAGLIWGIYEVFLGVRVALATPADKAIGFTAVSLVITLVVMLIVGFILNLALVPFGPHINLGNPYSP